MSFSATADSARDLFQRAKDLGYQGVEPRVESNHGHGIELQRTKIERRQIAGMARDIGIEICCLATGLRFADPAYKAKTISDARAYVELASDIGAPLLRVFGGELPAGMERAEAIQTVAGALSEIADDAAAANVAICLETHDHWCDPAHVAAVMEKVNHSSIAVNWDMMHPTRAAGVPLPEAHRILSPWIRHVHFHDGKLGERLEITRCGAGDFDLPAFFHALRDYSGFVSGEWIKCESFIDLSEELRCMRELEKSTLAEQTD